MNSCKECPWYQDEHTCILPIGNGHPVNEFGESIIRKKSDRTPRQHYKDFFGWECDYLSIDIPAPAELKPGVSKVQAEEYMVSMFR